MSKIEQELEIRIARRVIRDALKAGYDISVNDGEEIVLRNSRSFKEVLAAIRSTDDDSLYFNLREEGQLLICDGWVQFYWGNGCDVIHDWTPRIEEVLKGASALADKYC